MLLSAGSDKTPAAEHRSEILQQAFHFNPSPIRPDSSPSDAKGILTLPAVNVRATKLPQFSDGEFYTDKGLSELLSKQYPGRSFHGQSATQSHAANYAAVSYHDDVRRRNLQGFEDMVEVFKHTGDPAAAKKLQQQIYDAFIRNPTDLEKAMDKSANGGRR